MKKNISFMIIFFVITFFSLKTNVFAAIQGIALQTSGSVYSLSNNITGNTTLFFNNVDFTSNYDGVMIFNFSYRPSGYVPTGVMLYGNNHSVPLNCDISSTSSYTDSTNAITSVTALCPVQKNEVYDYIGFSGTFNTITTIYIGQYGTIVPNNEVNVNVSSQDYTSILNTINSNLSSIQSIIATEWRWTIPNIDTNVSTIEALLEGYFQNNPAGTISSINSNTQDIKDSLNSDNTSGAESSAEDFVDNSAFDDNTGLSAIISMPLTFVNTLSSACSPISLTIPYMDYQFQLPCIQSIVNHYAPALVVIIKVVVNGLIIYWIMLDIFKIVKNAKNPDDDRIEVLEL